MMDEYEKRFYIPAIQQFEQLLKNNAQAAKDLSNRHKRLITHWHAVQIQKPLTDSDGPYLVDQKFQVTAQVFLGELKIVVFFSGCFNKIALLLMKLCSKLIFY